MAGDWIPIDTTLPDKPEIARVAKALGKSRDEIVGMVVRFWIWAQAHTADGHLPGMTTEMLAEVVHVPHRLFGELQKVGWLSETKGGLVIPNFERWLSQGAKRRLRERDKKRRQRSEAAASLSRFCPDFVPDLSRSHRDKNGTTEEERRGEDNPSIKPTNSENLSLLENEEGGPELFRGEVAGGDSPPPASLPLHGGISPNGWERVSGLVFECRGKEPTWRLPQDFYGELKSAFEGIDVAAEILKAHTWLKANPDRKKTAKGMRAFLWRWLARTTDSQRVLVRKEDDDIYGVS